MSISATDVQKAYLAYFGRPADPVGLAYWETQSSEAMYASFASSNEYVTMYAGMTNAQIVAQVYENILGRTADSAGLLYWTNQLNSGAMTIDNVVVYMINAVSGDDITTINNRLTYCADFTAAIDTSAEILGYSGTVAATAARSALLPVTDDASLATALAALPTSVATVVAAGSSSSGQTYSLTTGADNILGTSGNDTIGGVNNAAGTQLSAVDTINGNGGVDTLTLELNAAYAGGATITNVENISVTMTAGAGTFNAEGIAGLETLTVNSSVVGTGFTNVGNLAAFSVKNTAAWANTITYKDSVVSGTADTANVTVDNLTAGAVVNVNSFTADAAGVETIVLNAQNNNSTYTVNTNDTSVKTLTMTGAVNQSVTLGAGLNTTVTTIDAAAMTGNLVLGGFGAANVAITGGSGNDTFNLGTTFSSSDSIDGGAGTNTLGVTTSATRSAITAAEWAKVANVQTVAFTHSGVAAEDVAQDASLLTGVTTFRSIASAAASEDFAYTKVADSTNFNVQGAAETLTITLNNSTGLSDVLNLSLGSATTATASQIATTLANVAGLETLNIAALSPTVGGVNHVIAADNVAGKHVITGDGNLALQNVTAATAIDATALKGNLVVGNAGATGYAVAGGTIQAGSGDDTLVGGAGAQTFSGNDGADTLAGIGGQDTLVGGAGADRFVYTTAATNAGLGGSQMDTISDFVSGTDKIVFDVSGTIANNGVALNGLADILAGVTFTAGTAAMAALGSEITNGTTVADTAAVYTQLTALLPGAAELAGSNVAGTATVARVVTFTSGAAAGSYLVINDSTAGFQAANDMVINVTGLTGTISASDFSFV